jgi:large subunit ribosomal protein L17
MVTTARAGTLAARRRVIARLRKPRLARELFDVVVPALAGRAGGCTRITRIGIRRGDGAQTACLEWVGIVAPDKRRKPKPTEPTKKP